MSIVALLECRSDQLRNFLPQDLFFVLSVTQPFTLCLALGLRL